MTDGEHASDSTDSTSRDRSNGRGSTPGADVPEPAVTPPLHPSLAPTGEHIAHSAVGSLVGGVLVCGGLGWLLDHWLGTGRILTALGVVAGFFLGFAIVYVRFGRDE